MSMTISLPPDVEPKLAERAASVGQNMPDYVRRLITKDVELPSFADQVRPVHQSVKDSGNGESELDSLLETAIAHS